MQTYNAFDGLPDESLNDLVALAAELCQAPVALITIVNESHQRVISSFGTDLQETSREVAFCSHAICQPDVFVVPDATADERFAHNPLVAGNPKIRFYAGAPLLTPSGHALGSLCVIDRMPRELRPEQERVLRILSRHVMTQLELRRSLAERQQAEEALGRAHAELEVRVRERTAQLNDALVRMRAEDAERRRAQEALRESSDRLSLALASSNIGLWKWNVQTNVVWFSDEWKRQIGYEPHEIADDLAEWSGRVHPDDLARLMPALESYLTSPNAEHETEFRLRHRDGSWRWILARSRLQRDSSGRPLRMLGCHFDFTAHHQLEEQLHALTAHLECVREEERTGIARELHDELGQLLTALRMDVAWMARGLAERRENFESKAAGRLAAMKDLIDQAIASVQRISSDLRPGILHDLGLVAALSWQAQEFESRSGIRCVFHPPDDELVLDERRAVALYRAFQEALTNVARHANAKSVESSLTPTEGHVVLEVRDDGRGMRLEAVTDPHSFGLMGMRERALSFGGQTTFTSVPGHGTTVLVTIPVSSISLPEATSLHS